MIPIQQAFDQLIRTVKPLGQEAVPLLTAPGRYLTANVVSDVDSPPHDKSVMDGFAIRSSDINSGIKTFHVVETIAAGGWPDKEILQGQAARIMTGAPMPVGTDSVVMVELTEFDETNESVLVNLDQLPTGRHMMHQATSMSAGQTVFPLGHRIRPTDIGLLAETGNHRVTVGGLPSIAVLPTGDELVDCSETPGRGFIRNSNGPMVHAMAEGLGLPVHSLGIGRDDETQLTELVAAGLNHDVLILSGGVSAGQFDLVPKVLTDAGVSKVFHKVAIKPGKPIWFGVLEKADRSCYVFGLPGNPVSSMVGFQIFIRTAIRRLMSASDPMPNSVLAKLENDHEVRGNRTTYWPGMWVNDDSSTRIVRSLEWQGSSDLRALGQADVLIEFPVEADTKTKSFAAGEHLRVFSLV